MSKILAGVLPGASLVGLFAGINNKPQLIGMPQLDGIVMGFDAQRAILDSLLAAQPARHDLFFGQIQQIISAQTSILRLAANVNYGTTLVPLLDSVSRYGEVHSHLAALAARHPVGLLRGSTARSGRLYDDYLAGLPPRPIARRAAVASYAGDTQTGLIIAESLAAPGIRADDREELAGQLSETVLEPWQTGPSSARADLFDILAVLDPELPDWLKAAWDDIVRDGPKSASKVANCAVECIDRALRVAAPTADVLVWLEGIPSKSDYLHDGRPTRKARVMFVMRNRARRDTALAVAQIDALGKLIQEVMNNLQSVKHGEAPSIVTMRSWVLAAEGALTQLFVHM